MAYKQRKRKVKKNIPEGIAHIHATFNNTIVLLDLERHLPGPDTVGAPDAH